MMERQLDQDSDQNEIKDKPKSLQSDYLIDKTLFLNCFLETGRCFSSLIALYNSRNRKIRNNYVKKTINQIKHYYYNTWYKISNFVRDITTVDRLTLEILSMTNYAALCKSSVDENAPNVLKKLVINGQVNFKFKGRNYNCKTPNCKALKNHLYNLISDGGKIPQNFEIFLLPYTNLTWNFMQSLSLNPRLLFHTNNRENFQKIFDYIFIILNNFGKINDESFLSIFPLPETVVIDIPPDFEISNKVDFNLATFEKIIERSREISNKSNNFKSLESQNDSDPKRYTNVIWSYEMSKDISFFRLFRMLGMPKRFQLYYDFDLEKIYQYSSEGCVMNYFSQNFLNLLIKKLSSLAEIRLNSLKIKKSVQEVVKPITNIDSSKTSAQPSFISQLKPIKNKYIKKMLFNGEKSETKFDPNDIEDAAELHVYKVNPTEKIPEDNDNNIDSNNTDNLMFCKQHTTDHDAHNSFYSQFQQNNNLVSIPESNEVSQSSFASLFGQSEYVLPVKTKNERDLHNNHAINTNTINTHSLSHDSSSIMGLLMPGTLINSKQSDNGLKGSISFTNILSPTIDTDKKTHHDIIDKNNIYDDSNSNLKVNNLPDETHLLNLSLLGDNTIDIYDNFATINHHIDRV